MDGDEDNGKAAPGAAGPMTHGSATDESLETPEGVAGFVSEDQLLFVPSHPVGGGIKAGTLAIETRLLADGRAVAMGFTALDKLVEALGEFQPWVAVPAGKLIELLAGTATVVLLDPTVVAEAPRWTYQDLEKAQAGGEVQF